MLYYLVNIFFVPELYGCVSQFFPEWCCEETIFMKPSSESASTYRNPLAISIVAMKRKHKVLPQEMENAH